MTADEYAKQLPEYDPEKWEYFFGGPHEMSKRDPSQTECWGFPSDLQEKWEKGTGGIWYQGGVVGYLYSYPRSVEAPTSGVAETLEQRGKTHGEFEKNAENAQYLKSHFRRKARWDELNNREREALDMIASKIARILSPKDASNPDDWHDIAGYATLAERSLNND